MLRNAADKGSDRATDSFCEPFRPGLRFQFVLVQELRTFKSDPDSAFMRQLYSFYYDAFWIALKSILEHKLRAFLTLIGIIIGVAAVVVVGASITGLKTYVVDKVGKVLGANHFMVTRIAFMGKMDDDQFEKMNRRNKDVVWEEYEYVKANCRMCSEVGAEMLGNSDLSQNGIEMPSTQIQGVTANFDVMEDKTLVEGRFLTSSEVEHSSEVCVIGSDVAEKFFPVGSPIGQSVKVRGIPLRVVGVEEKRGSFMGNSMDRHLYMPLPLYAQMFSRTGGCSFTENPRLRKRFRLRSTRPGSCFVINASSSGLTTIRSA